MSLFSGDRADDEARFARLKFAWGGGRGPAYFGGGNHLPAAPLSPYDGIQLGLWAALYLAFAFIVLSSRSGRRVVTFVVGSILLATAFAILRGLSDPHWYVGETRLETAYTAARPSRRVNACLGVCVGLYSYNVTLRSDDYNNFAFNNRFHLNFGGPARKRRDREFDHKLEAIALGLPNPMIVVAEYMESMSWEECLPRAGYFTRVTLLFAAASLTFCGLLLCSVPSHALRAQVMTGLILNVACWVYWFLMPSLDAEIRVEGVALKFHMGITFFLILFVGMVNVVFGLMVLWLRRTNLLAGFSTFFELDYDTPFDERRLREESDERRRRPESAAEDRKRQLLTQLYVDSRLRMTVRRLVEQSRSDSRKRAQSERLGDDVEVLGEADADERMHSALSIIGRGRSFSEVAYENESLI